MPGPPRFLFCRFPMRWGEDQFRFCCGVNDIAFAHQNKQFCIVTCGDDKAIKIWDVVDGCRQHTFKGHEAPVYSVCPSYKENIQIIFSTDIDGKIKAWLYDSLGSRVVYDAQQWHIALMEQDYSLVELAKKAYHTLLSGMKF